MLLFSGLDFSFAMFLNDCVYDVDVLIKASFDWHFLYSEVKYSLFKVNSSVVS